jgi:excisionase family DNA binding protein
VAVRRKCRHNSGASVERACDRFGMLNTPSERPLKLAEMARVLGVSVTWLRAEAERGALPHVKTDRGMLFDRATVEKLLSERAKREGVKRVK